MATKLSKVCIIGGGSAGLIALHELKIRGFQCVLLERLSHVAGIWKATPKNAVYDSLVTNLPKEIMAFSPRHPFNHDLPSFVTHEDMNQYLQDFALEGQLLRDIKFSCNVSSVTKIAEKHTWNVEYFDSTLNLLENFECDAVVVCNGHFNCPVSPNIPGIEHFKGEVLHSMSYKNPRGCKDKIVVVVGAKSSATDIARELVGVASEVHVCNRSHEGAALVVNHRYPERSGCNDEEYPIWIHPSIDHVETSEGGVSTVCFVNGDRVNADCIIFATGYRYDLPFIDELIDVNDKSIKPLYQHIFHCEDPTLAFIGLPHTIVPFPFFRYQAMWVAALYSHLDKAHTTAEVVVDGATLLPSEEARKEWVSEYEDSQRLNPDGGGYPRNYHHMGAAMWPYLHCIHNLLSHDEKSKESLDEEKYLNAMEEIYNDTGRRRPKLTGGSDMYRKCQYTLDRDSYVWTVTGPGCS